MDGSSQKKRRTVGLLLPDTYERITRRLWTGVEEASHRLDANLVCFVGDRLRKPAHPANIIYDLVGPDMIDCLIIWTDLIGAEVGPDSVAALCAQYGNLPMVSLRSSRLGFPFIEVDQWERMRDLVDHLIEMHDRHRFLFVGPHDVHEPSNIACRTLSKLLTERGLSLKPEHIMYLEDVLARSDLATGGGSHDRNRRFDAPMQKFNAMDLLLDERNLTPGVDFDAVIAVCASASVTVIQTLQARGIQIPGDVAVVGFTDTEATQATTPPLTVVRTPWELVGQKAVEMALDLAAGKQIDHHTQVSCELVLRQSCGCIATTVDEIKVLLPTTYTTSSRQEVLNRLSTNKSQMGTEMLSQLPERGLPAERLSKQLGILLDALYAFLTTESSTNKTEEIAFLHALEQLIRTGEDNLIDAGAWHNTLSVLRSRILSMLDEQTTLIRQAENLFQAARTIIGEASTRTQMWHRLQTEQMTDVIRHAGAALAATATVPDVISALVDWLPQLDIHRFFLSTYVDPASPTDEAQLLFAYHEGQQIKLDESKVRFPPKQLVPPDLLPAARYSLVVNPLYFSNEHLGFIILDAHPGDSSTYEALRVQISSGLKGAILYQQAVEARQEAEEANQLKSMFLSNVSHELRTPLSIIVARTELLKQELSAYKNVLPESLHNELEIIAFTSQQLDHLLGDVLDLGRGQLNKLTLNQVPLPLSQVIEQAAAAGKRMAKDKGLTWRTAFPAQLPCVNGDAARLRQVLLNLLSNAVKFTDHGEIELSVTVSSSEVVIGVRDTGLGIPPGEFEQIFDEFRQSSRTTGKRGFGGIGLGLAISRRLVEMHGGRIWAESSGSIQQGSTFYFSLPTRAELTPEPGKPENRNLVLLVSERKGSGHRVREYLEDRGYSVDELAIADEQNWLERVIETAPGAVVLDIEPAADKGWTLMRVLKSHPLLRDVPVVFYGLIEEQESGSVLALDYLTKPVPPEHLMRAVESQGLAADASQAHNILVVDDTPLIVDWHTQILLQRMPNCHVLSARNGKEALSVMAGKQPDLVLLDLMMPEMDGFTVLEKMRDQQELRDVPVIVMTAHDLMPDAMERLQHGVAAVLMKGMLTPDETLAQVEAALSRSKQFGSETQRLVRKAMAYIHAHYTQPISRTDIARFVTVSDEYLSNCFHHETGLRLVDYINRYRVKQAKRLLKMGNASITQVALDVGFSSQAYFSRIFRQEAGVSPSAYRRGERLVNAN